MPAEALANEIQGLPPDALLERAGDLEVYLTSAEHMPNVLREIGRLREITFRAVGEGTGRALDLDRFDWYYLHLFVWNARKQEIAGAYRLQGSDQTVDLYTRTLFQYEDRFLKAMGPALELGRSFIRPSIRGASLRCCCCGKASASSSRATRAISCCSARSASAINIRPSRES
ncbi:MAG: GNAT family N-acetyltransferase [Acidobacteriota bacterium]